MFQNCLDFRPGSELLEIFCIGLYTTKAYQDKEIFLTVTVAIKVGKFHAGDWRS